MIPYRHLPGDAHLSLRGDACLAMRAGQAACNGCAAACPVAALSVGNDGPQLQKDCLHCGRCAAVCPSGALKSKGFEEAVLPNGNFHLSIDCWKVPATVCGPQTLRVPCLAGISLAQLFEWMLAAGDRTLTLVDRGWCAHCLVGGSGGFAGEALLDEAQVWLEACGVPAAQRPKRKADLLPAALMPQSIPDADNQIAMGRRAFFGRLGKEIARTERPAVAPSGPRAALRQSACALPARERWLAALDALAGHHGRPLPTQALPQLVVAASCGDHGVCAGVCPTGALTRDESDAATQLSFDARACVSCARCTSACPHGALRLTDGGSTEQVTIRTLPLRACIECGRLFADTDGAACCPRCVAAKNQARSLFGPLIADRPPESSSTNAVDTGGFRS